MVRRVRVDRMRVSMPFVGLYPFLHIIAPAMLVLVACVNALSRALSISTQEKKLEKY